MCDYTLFNKNAPEMTYDIVIEMGLMCSCELYETDPDCDGELVVFPYGDVVDSLGFDPEQPIFLDPINEDMPLLVRYAWDPSPNASNIHPELEVIPRFNYGWKSDHETAENPLGWYNHVEAVICIPIHFGPFDQIALQQLED